MTNSNWIQLTIVIVVLSLAILVKSIPPEGCLVTLQCATYCQSHGYRKGSCRTRIVPATLAPLRRICECYDCDPKYCARHCQKIGLKYTGCTCFNFFPRNLLVQRNDMSVSNDCNDGVVYCQCSV